VRRRGCDVTLVGCGYSARLCRVAAEHLAKEEIECEVIDLRVINPLDTDSLIDSVRRTGRLLAVDGDWSSCGLAGELLARAAEAIDPQDWKARPARLTLPDAPAPTSSALEKGYYTRAEDVCRAVRALMDEDHHETCSRFDRRHARAHP
jgi:acetoin:2,6-dichlorophenolindophenol oxidoreductase subunit beta